MLISLRLLETCMLPVFRITKSYPIYPEEGSHVLFPSISPCLFVNKALIILTDQEESFDQCIHSPCTTWYLPPARAAGMLTCRCVLLVLVFFNLLSVSMINVLYQSWHIFAVTPWQESWLWVSLVHTMIWQRLQLASYLMLLSSHLIQIGMALCSFSTFSLSF